MNIHHLNKIKYISNLLGLFVFLNIAGCSSEDGTDTQSTAVEVHEEFYIENSYSGTESCLSCHEDVGNDVLKTAHWKWQGLATNITGQENGLHGKNDLINNFCIAIPSNEGRCTQCHIGYNYKDNTYDFTNAENIDCLVCHDQTSTYKKDKKTAGMPVTGIDLLAVAKSVGKNKGVPQRVNCIGCHANAGGGDNVKHGDLSSALTNTTREFDVHMGTDGENFTCVVCHDVKRTHAGEQLDHGIGGMPYHTVDEGTMIQCSDSGCHGDNNTAHAAKDLGGLFVTPGSGTERHQRLSCQACHIPAIARQIATTTSWDWSTAGQDKDPIPVDPITGRVTYDKKKGTFIWEKNVRPILRVHNGKWNKLVINVNDQFTTTPVMMAEPAADPNDQSAMIYPFKRIVGKQIADANNKTMLVPHLFGLAGGPNPYWGNWNWNLALEDAAAYTGQTYSGDFEFVDTEMLLSVNHEVAPSAMTLGQGGKCADCHGANQINWTSLGWQSDPHPMGGN